VTPLRFAIVGTSGFAARAVAPALLASQTELAGVLGSTPERTRRFASALDTTAYGSLEQLAADPAVDAVWVAAHDRLHEPFGVACLTAGKHVLMEKPMATSAAGARNLIAAAEQAGVVLRVGCHQRFRPVYRQLRDLIAGGELGELGFANLQFSWEFEEERVAGSWRATRAQSGGSWVLKEFGAHLLDLALWWTGGPAELRGAALATHRHAVETEDSAAVLLALHGGAIGTVEVSAAMAGRTHSIYLQGTRGWARAQDVWRGKGTLERSDAQLIEYHDVGFLHPYVAQLADFAAAVQGHPTIGADGHDGLAVLEIIEAALSSAQAERPAPSGAPAVAAGSATERR
jgi:predicted dehydrogenase